MSRVQDLKAFVSERLHAAASEIFGVVEKTISDYEEKCARLKEENDRNRSLLDVILKTRSQRKEAQPIKSSQDPAAAAATTSTGAAGFPGASHLSPPRKARDPPRNSSEFQCSFTSRTDLLKFATGGDCRFCLKKIPATERHLTKKHYLLAVKFTACGTDRFVVPCTCTDLIQGRSHWHCPYCSKIIYRKCNFEVHISKQHGHAVRPQNRDKDIDQPSVSAIEEEVPQSPKPYCKQELGSLDDEVQRVSLLRDVKEEKELLTQVSHPGWQNLSDLQTEGEQVQKGSIQMSSGEHHAQDSEFRIAFADGYIQDLSVEKSKGHQLPNSSNEPLETPLNSGVVGICQPSEESRQSTLRLKAHSIKRKLRVKAKRYLPTLGLNIKTSTQYVSQNPTSPYCCKTCGKTFHYMYTLRTHVRTHASDKIRICGLCGRRLDSKESLVQHIQNHTKRNKCGICGKLFSDTSRLKRHLRFHRPRGLNIMSLT
ncbi:uncharacterized protein AB9W97_001692 isoform 2-T2 [Spinachia spinachia]